MTAPKPHELAAAVVPLRLAAAAGLTVTGFRGLADISPLARGIEADEVYTLGKWRTHTLCPRDYGEGYLDHHRDAPGPRCAMRLVDPAGRVRIEVEAVDTVSIGMRAGWPTAEQYEAAGAVALERARLTREREERELEFEAARKRERWS